jgi:zinc D-Ala-D-Ala dipeptidase
MGFMNRILLAKIKIICTVYSIYLLGFNTLLQAQIIPVIKGKKMYCKEVRKDSSFAMQELKAVIPNLLYDLRYATNSNFTHQQLYKKGDRTYLRKPAASALKEVQNELTIMGLGLKIFDAYRPYSATKTMWDLVGDERYVANPKNGSGHNRGLAVDLTIIDLNTGSELDMGTGFDNFTDTAHHNFTNLPERVLKNRVLLRGLMEKHGFKALSTEWWHYSWPNDKNYSVLDIDFKKLGKGCH